MASRLPLPTAWPGQSLLLDPWLSLSPAQARLSLHLRGTQNSLIVIITLFPGLIPPSVLLWSSQPPDHTYPSSYPRALHPLPRGPCSSSPSGLWALELPGHRLCQVRGETIDAAKKQNDSVINMNSYLISCELMVGFVV